MRNNTFILGKTNYILIGISLFMIILGFALMTGSSSTMQEFDPSIFSFRRIVFAPNLCFAGYILLVVGILYKNKSIAKEVEQ